MTLSISQPLPSSPSKQTSHRCLTSRPAIPPVTIVTTKELPSVTASFVGRGKPTRCFLRRRLSPTEEFSKKSRRKRNAFLHGANQVVCIRFKKADRKMIGMIRIELNIKSPTGCFCPSSVDAGTLSEMTRSSGAAKPNRTSSQDAGRGLCSPTEEEVIDTTLPQESPRPNSLQ
ncbi:hypothetical protein ILT44_26005 [Microvirga sp. BT689]|nr:hypothetical protein [Microvirga arvi]